ncbi:GNAT family N-acetyltransferase [Candidatus Poribacteria bacterium]|nr:GNAT family N-acetyltransferase [Candidatus Poribacteria bacterium]
MKIRSQIITDRRDLIDLRPRWEKLQNESGSRSISTTWTWMWTWWEVFGEEGELFVILIYGGDELIGIAPLWRRRIKRFGLIPMLQIRLLATGERESDEICSDYLDFILRRGREEEAIEGIFDALQGERWDEIVIESLEARSGTVGLLKRIASDRGFKIQELGRIPSFCVELPESWESYLAQLSQSFRKKIRRNRRDLAKAHFRSVKTHSELEAAFGRLIELHQERMRSLGRPGVFSSERFTRFHRLISRRLLDEGKLYMTSLDLEGETIAINYGFREGDALYIYQSGIRSLETNRISPGIALESLCIEDAIRSGLRRYDLMRGDEEYKLHWRPVKREMVRLKIRRGR